jgi:hypothetical protein
MVDLCGLVTIESSQDVSKDFSPIAEYRYTKEATMVARLPKLNQHWRLVYLITCLMTTLFWIPNSCLADRFQLKDGRELTGKVVHSDTQKQGDREETRLAVEIETGVLVRIYESDLVRGGHQKSDSRQIEYEQRAAEMEDSAQSHYQMAQWCSQQGLNDLARAHYLRTIDLQPDHKEARAAVKHTRSESSGRWIKREDQMIERGKVFHQGKWKFPEYIPMDDDQQLLVKEKAELQKVINRWHNAAVKGDAQALASLSQLDNPLVVDYLSQLLLDKQKAGQPAATVVVKQAYIMVLAKFNDGGAYATLAHACINDADQSVRTAALDALAASGRQLAIPVMMGYLRHANNLLVNRAGYALGQLQADSAILAMIEALITRHQFEGSGADTYSPSAGGLSLGGNKKQMRDLQNEEVLSALSKITGQGGLGFDKSRWKAWYASVYAPPVDDLRRDP